MVIILFPYAVSEVELYYHHKELFVQVISLDAKRLTTLIATLKVGYFRENLETVWD